MCQHTVRMNDTAQSYWGWTHLRPIGRASPTSFLWSNIEPMTAPSTSPSDRATGAANALTRVRDQSEQIKGAVAECAEDLSSVNSSLKEELAQQPLQAGLGDALAQNEAVEAKVQACADDLTIVTGALEIEMQERQVLEHALAAAQAQEKSARHAAFHDALTALPNRVLFNDRLEHGLAQAKRHDWTLAVMFIDLDRFKGINDTHGHVVGDSVLQTIAGRLKAMTRDDDTVSRHGGDEFLYLLLEIKQEADAIAIAEKVMAAFGEPCDVILNDVPLAVNVGCSIGIAMYPNDGVTAETLILSADRAMYQAKRTQSGYALASALACSGDEHSGPLPGASDA